MTHFHTSWNEEHRDWQCSCGIAFGAGSTPESATLACLMDLSNGFAEAIGWLGTPKPHQPVVNVVWCGPDSPWWVAEFTDDFWLRSWTGYGDSPEEAVLALMNRTDYRHGYSG
jgi:hypothetical protein